MQSVSLELLLGKSPMSLTVAQFYGDPGSSSLDVAAFGTFHFFGIHASLTLKMQQPRVYTFLPDCAFTILCCFFLFYSKMRVILEPSPWLSSSFSFGVTIHSHNRDSNLDLQPRFLFWMYGAHTHMPNGYAVSRNNFLIFLHICSPAFLPSSVRCPTKKSWNYTMIPLFPIPQSCLLWFKCIGNVGYLDGSVC